GAGAFGAGGPGGGGGFGGAPGAGRLFNDVIGGQISWLIPFAVLALVSGLLLTGRRYGAVLAGAHADAAFPSARRPDATDPPSGRRSPARAALLLWGGWLAVHYIVFGFSAGTFHPYYTTAMAPAVAALTGLGGVLMWQARTQARTRALPWAWALPAGIAVTGAWAFVLLRRTPDWVPWLSYAVAGLCAVAAIGLATPRIGRRGRMRAAAIMLVIGLVGGLAGPAAYGLTPLASPVNGTNPTAGPAATGRFGGPGGPGGPGGTGGPTGVRGPIPGGQAADPGGQAGDPGAGPPAGTGIRQRGGPGGDVSAALISYLEDHQGGATWLAAVGDAHSASSIMLSTGGKPVIAMGGFTGGDPAMTVTELQRYVAEGRLKYVLLGGGMGGLGRGDGEVTTWVRSHGTVVDPAEYGGTDTARSLYALA
ncbi:glycosyl transferase family 39, partial [Sphaerisporangium dianthi]